MNKALIIGVLLLIANLASGQKLKREHFYAQIQGMYGNPILYSDSLGSELTVPFLAGNFRLGVQANGEQKQDQFLGFQKFGIGLFHVNLNNKDTLGNPWAAYMFLNAPIFRTGKFQLNYDAAVGLGWNFSEFDAITNNQNDLIGSEIAAYFSIGLNAEYRISNRLSLDLGADFIHFSNGALQTPNKGMNLNSVHLGISYFFQRPKSEIEYKPAEMKIKNYDKIDPYNELDITYGFGGKTTNREYGRGAEYFCSTLMLNYYRRHHWVGKYGGGIDWLYDSSLKQDYPRENVSMTKFMFVGIHINYELMVSKISLLGQIGTYVYKGSDAKGIFYFRVGLKYYLTKNFYAGVALKTANGFKADYIEFGMGYKFKLKKN